VKRVWPTSGSMSQHRHGELADATVPRLWDGLRRL
jgi:hypothetical protein